MLNILFLGDVTDRSGREAVYSRLPALKRENKIDFTIVNGENSAHGKGITVNIYQALKQAGADVITLGNHAFSKHEIIRDLPFCPDLIRPANMEPADCGKSWAVRTCREKTIAVINILGSVYMDEAIRSVFPVMDDILRQVTADIIITDLHAEATSEKELFFEIYKKRLNAVIGTHTHVQTADERVSEGCAFLSDVGMCGPYESIIGRSIEEIKERTLTGARTRFTPAEGPAMICGCVISIDEVTGATISIRRIQERPE